MERFDLRTDGEYCSSHISIEHSVEQQRMSWLGQTRVRCSLYTIDSCSNCTCSAWLWPKKSITDTASCPLQQTGDDTLRQQKSLKKRQTISN